jgi:ATP-binding cassette, subfamily C (CFTR/MRP), member 1
VVLWGTGHGTTTKATLPSGILSLVSTVALSILSTFEHTRSIRPSAVIQTFFLVTLLLDLARIRMEWLLDGNSTEGAIFTATFALRMVLLSLESLQKWRHASVPVDAIPPELRSGVIGRTLFLWLNPLFMKGYSNDLSMDDLYQIDEDLKGAKLYERLLKSWQAGAYHQMAIKCHSRE